MSVLRLWSAGCVLAVLSVAALGAVWRVEHGIATSAQAAMRVSTLLSARQALQLHVLSACAGVESSFDHMNSALRALHALDSEADAADMRKDELAPGTAELTQAARALRAEDRAVEMFKTDLALLRLSSRHFPVAVDELTRRGMQPPAADQDGTSDRNAAVREAMHVLRTEMERYTAAPTRAAAKRLEAAIAALTGLRASFEDDDAARADLSVVLGHARAILERRERVDSFARDFERSPVRQHLEAALVAYQLSARARTYTLTATRLVASLLAGVGLLAIGLAVFRARKAPAPR